MKILFTGDVNFRHIEPVDSTMAKSILTEVQPYIADAAAHGDAGMISSVCGTLFDIQRGSYVDGPGIRTTVFYKGCDLRCAWCHNPESQSRERQLLYYRDRCTGCGTCSAFCPAPASCTLCGKCALMCPHDAKEICGKDYTVDEVYKIIEKDMPFYQSSGGGVTFSGGECMLQVDFLTSLAKRCHENGIHTAIDTAGHVPWDRFLQVLPYTSLFLYDVKCITPELHRAGTGVSNEQILANLRRLSEETAVPIHIRIPLVPGFNDSDTEMEKIAAFLSTIRHDKVELLPYHAMGEHKYAALGRTYTAYKLPDADTLARCRRIVYE